MAASEHTVDGLDSQNHISTEVAKRKLEYRLHRALSHQANTLIEAPTSLGKSYTVASTRWRDYPEVTGGQPVILLHQTQRARREAVEVSKENGVEYAVLKGRKDLCTVADGDYDDQLPPIDGMDASDWFDRKCDIEQVQFTTAHRHLRHQIRGDLPCSCDDVSQYSGILRDSDGELQKDIIHATDKFAHIDWLIEDSNVIFDEQPTYTKSLNEANHESLRRTIGSLLTDRAGEQRSWWERLVIAVVDGDEEALKEYRTLFAEDPPRNWLFSQGYVHASATTIGRALTNAKAMWNNRYRGTDGRTTVVLDDHRSLHVHQPPNLSKARCVIGLDAHPSEILWNVNTVRNLTTEKVLSDVERRNWRIHERKLLVKQVGKANNYCTRGWKSSSARKKIVRVIEELREQYGKNFRTAITSKALQGEVEDLLRAGGIENPATLYYNNLRSNNNLKGESVGLLFGCIDPGDDYILNILALCGLEAEPQTQEDGSRAFGRGFVGPDSEAATELLWSVRENNIMQAIGRYARSPGEGGDGATVYAMTDAIPEQMVDERVPGVTGEVTDKKREIEEYVRENSPVTTTEVVKSVESSRPHVIDTLRQMEEQGVVTKSAGTGPNGADVYRYEGGSFRQPIDLGF